MQMTGASPHGEIVWSGPWLVVAAPRANTRPFFQATTPIDPRVLDEMMPFLTEQFGNPHSRTHSYGWNAESAVEKAREEVASLIGADPKEIIFTSVRDSPR